MEAPDFIKLSEARVAVVGLGLMGGSLALALRERCRELLGADSDPAALAFALERNIVDRAVSFDRALDADWLILAAPVRTILAQLADLARRPPPTHPVIVLDLGSTKVEIVAAMRALPAGYAPIGGHPMCGKEVSGIAHAEAGLFRDKLFVLTPLESTAPSVLALGLTLIAAIGARARVLPAEQADVLAAAGSHLPYLAAALLVRSVEDLGDDQVWDIAASGFRDTSRLAASDVTMMTDILLTNRLAILEALGRFRGELDKLAALLEAGEAQALAAYLSSAAQRRRGLYQ
jgi:prephenate dehydrogenase